MKHYDEAILENLPIEFRQISTGDKERGKFMTDLRLVVPAVSVKPREGIGVYKDGAIVHTPSSIEFCDPENSYRIASFFMEEYMLNGVKTDIEYVQLLMVIDARANINVSTISYKQFVEYVGMQFEFNMESYSLKDA